MQCINHPEVDQDIVRCLRCQQPFCPDCVVMLRGYWYCGPCKAEIPGFVELQEKHKKDLVVVGYDVDDTAEKARAFATEYKINDPVLLGEGREDVQDAYGPIWGIPASFLISKDGKVCKRHMGIAPKETFEKEIKALL